MLFSIRWVFGKMEFGYETYDVEDVFMIERSRTLKRLHSLIERTTPHRDYRDGVKWRWSNSCIFPNKKIVGNFHESSVPILPKMIINSLWKTKIPPRAQLILWLANLEKLKTGDSLFEKNLIDA